MTFDQRNIVIGMLTAGIINKQDARHFQACESTTSSFRTKIRQTDIIPTDHVEERQLTDVIGFSAAQEYLAW